MCTPWTLTRFVRWRVRDLASCFLACRFPLGKTDNINWWTVFTIFSLTLFNSWKNLYTVFRRLESTVVTRHKSSLHCQFSFICSIAEEPETHHSSSPQLPIGNLVFETKDDTRDKKSNKRLSRRNRCDKDRQLNLSPTVSKNTASVEKGSDNSNWTPFSDEEYIVFCFREDGAFDVVKDNSKSEESNQSSRSSGPVNRKVN